MKIFFMSFILLSSFSAAAEDVLKEFVDAFDKAECMANVGASNVGDPKDYLAKY